MTNKSNPLKNQDSILIARCLKHDETAQRQLYVKYRVRWYILCQRYGKTKFEADDLLQEGLISIFNSLHQYDSNKSQFSTWSSRVIVNAALRYLKKNSWNSTFSELDMAKNTNSTEVGIQEQLAERELIDLLQKLPTGYRIVFNMYAIEGYSHKEISAALEITIGTSKSQLSKARKMLRTQLETHLIS